MQVNVVAKTKDRLSDLSRASQLMSVIQPWTPHGIPLPNQTTLPQSLRSQAASFFSFFMAHKKEMGGGGTPKREGSLFFLISGSLKAMLTLTRAVTLMSNKLEQNAWCTQISPSSSF